MHLFSYVFLFLTFSSGFSLAQNWKEITGPSKGEIPGPTSGKVNWQADLKAAADEAKKTGRPLFVTLRCLPCKQCAEFDKSVLDGSPTLTPLLKRFVTVRLTDAALLDQRIFPYKKYQDLDLSWWGYFLSPKGEIYGVFGGKDHVSDATRISEPALVNTLQRVLAHHYDPRREGWKIDGAIPNFSKPQASPKDLPGYKALIKKRPGMANQSCVHCHQVADAENYGALEAGRFNLKAFTQPWPFPENVGIQVDRDHGLRVTKVNEGSAAAKAEMKVGDKLAMAGNRRLFGQADFRGVLHRAPLGDAKIPIGWLRGTNYMSGELDLKDGWRKSEIAWRKSVYDGVYGEYLGFFPLKGPRQGRGSMSIRPFMGKAAAKRPWYKLGLRPNMEIIAINGRTDDWNSRELLTWFKLNHKAGDKVTIRVKGGKEFTATLPIAN